MNRKAREVPPAIDSLSPRGGAKHRMLKPKILELLQAAGETGLTSDQISERLEVLKHRIQSWFYTTGNRDPHVQKVGVNHWRYQKSA